jgi:hypothetical protein
VSLFSIRKFERLTEELQEAKAAYVSATAKLKQTIEDSKQLGITSNEHRDLTREHVSIRDPHRIRHEAIGSYGQALEALNNFVLRGKIRAALASSSTNCNFPALLPYLLDDLDCYTMLPMSAKAKLARALLENIAQGRLRSVDDAIQVRDWAVCPEDSLLSLEEIAQRILDPEESRSGESSYG